MWELIILTVVVIGVLSVNGVIDSKGFFEDNSVYFKLLKEDDYDFLVRAKYGEKVDPEVLFSKRIKNAALIFAVMMVLFLTVNGINTFLKILICAIIAIFIFKSGYSNLRSYYKKHLHDIDLLLPYYLKSLEVLVQYYTVPIAIQFAKEYPVRDSMRMMRLLYRLGLGLQENKEEQLLLLSKTVSGLQNKAREQKYKERLEKMQSKTMIMLGATGAGVIILLLVSMLMLMTNL